MRKPRWLVAATTAAVGVGLFMSGAAAAASQQQGSATTTAGDAGGQLPYEDATLPVDQRVADLLSRMTLEEKVGQMTQAERGAVDGDTKRITDWKLGSLLSGGGSTPAQNTPAAWADMVDGYQKAALQTRLHIPLLYGIDTVHGDGNMYGATVFPHNIGLGATRDPSLVERVYHIAAEETRSTGPQWAFAPCLCAAQDDRWGRTYESFSENPELVEQMETAIDGLQGPQGHLSDPDRVLASAKHFAGDGDTKYGTGSSGYKIDQGVAVTDHQDFWDKALQQYLPAVRKHHVGTIMPSYSSVDWTEDGVGNPVKMHAHKELITDVLKGQMGFDGFVISDYNAIEQLPGSYAEQVRTAVNAGVDMFMEPWTAQQFEKTLIDEVQNGGVSMSRIDDAVSRILKSKFDLGLFEHPYTDRRYLGEVGSSAHHAVARQAAAESQVLLKNRANVLPVKPQQDVYVAGSNADNIGNQAGGWTLTWQGGSTNKIPGTTILDGINQLAGRRHVTYSEDASAPIGKHDLGVVVVGETPYAEGYGDVGGPQWAWDPADHGVPRQPQTMHFSDADKAAIDQVCQAAARCVVVVVSGRPMIIDPKQLEEMDGLVAAWLPGSEGAGVADTLFGRRPFTGKLPVTWPRSLDQEPINVGDADYDPLFPYGYGLTTNGQEGRVNR
ncbi:MAG TPA: glycoside hydrolase family 3 protein [Nocardioidaceae bacterium]|nr:glycoside hydrolase family 3 protein [Nocardioidaceae bacterium]